MASFPAIYFFPRQLLLWNGDEVIVPREGVWPVAKGFPHRRERPRSSLGPLKPLHATRR